MEWTTLLHTKPVLQLFQSWARLDGEEHKLREKKWVGQKKRKRNTFIGQKFAACMDNLGSRLIKKYMPIILEKN
jgi:hypothetical protein